MNADKLKNHIFSRISNVLKSPSGHIKYPYVDPGAGYGGELWDWDSYFTAVALCNACKTFDEMELSSYGITRKQVTECIRGSILNFLDCEEQDGYIPIMVSDGGLFEGYFSSEYRKGTPLNQHKPFLCQGTLNVSEFCGDYGWFDVDKLVKYLEYYERNQFDEKSGLFFWQDDIMVGIDNNPTVFYRNERSSADIYLNCFMYSEYVACAQILQKLNDQRAMRMTDMAERLKRAINAEMWDERDGLYYSQDICFCSVNRKVKDVTFHSGLTPHWKSMPLKIRFWGCFLPLYAGVCDKKQADKMIEHLSCNDDILTDYGIRTLAKNEKMYSLEQSSNPSNWLGAIWTVANYCVYKGLQNYGCYDVAERLRTASVKLLSDSVELYGDLFESYHPDTGEPFMHRGFLSWNLLALNMLKDTDGLL